jgi:hypothetical protein
MPGGGLPDFPPPGRSSPPADVGKPTSVVLSGASVTRERRWVIVNFDYRVEVPRKSRVHQFHLMLKTAGGKVHDMWVPEAERQESGTVSKRFIGLRPDQVTGPVEIYLEMRELGQAKPSEVVSNRLTVEVH